MFVKQANKDTLFETFEEAIKAENKYLTYEPERSRKIDTFYHKRTEKSSSDKERAFDVEQLHNSIIALTSKVAGLKKKSEISSSKEYFRNQFRQNTVTSKKQILLVM